MITASGLGWQRAAAVILRVAQRARMEQQLNLQQHQHHQQQADGHGAPPPSRPHAGPSGCVLVLGAAPWQRALISAELARHDPALPPPVDVTNEVPAADRVALYGGGGAGGPPLFVTPRILTVDLLSRRLLPGQVGGVLVLNAHRVSDTGGEGFALALLRGAGGPGGGRGPGVGGGGAASSCFIRALSDAPTAFNQGFNKVCRREGEKAGAWKGRGGGTCGTGEPTWAPLTAHATAERRFWDLCQPPRQRVSVLLLWR